MQLFDRKIELIINNKHYTYPEFEIEFDVPHTTGGEIDVAEINIYNLSDTSTNSILNNAQVILNAGYGVEVGTIFTGRVNKVLNEWSGNDKITTIMATMYGSSFRNKKLNKTYKNVRASFILQDLSRHFGIAVGEISPKDDKFYKSKSVSGNIYNSMKKIARETDSKIYTRHRQIFIRPDKIATKTGTIINSNTGLIGTPVKEEKEEKEKKIVEYKVVSLLNHRIQKDTWVRVQSKSLNGTFKVYNLTHTKDFKTEITLRP